MYTCTQHDIPDIPYLQPLMPIVFVQLCMLDTPRGEAPTSSLSSSVLSNCNCACNVMQVEATNELGDVHAHFGSWPEAVQAWHDALDCIMGPYQVNLPMSHSLAACPIVAAVHDTDCTLYLLHVHSITVDCCLHRPSAARRIACCAAT